MLPPICTSLPACRKMCAISAVVVDLPLVPVIATNGAAGARRRRSRQNSSMSPMISTPVRAGQFDHPVRLRMRQRNAGRQHQRGDFRPVDGAQVRRRDAGAGRLRHAVGAVVAGDHIGAARQQRAGACQSRSAEPEQRHLASGECGDRDHAVTATSGSTIRPAPARSTRSRSGSRSAARSSLFARSGDGSAPSGTRACRSA